MTAENGSASRDYMVLRIDADVFEELSTITAANAEQACRRAAEDLEPAQLEAGVRLVAVPTRHWRPHNYRTQTETRIVAS